MGTSITPVLSSTAGYLTDVRDQIAVLLRFFIMNPSDTSEVLETISMRRLAATYENSREQLAAAAMSTFTNLLNQKFPDYTFDVNITASNYDEHKEYDPRYTLNIEIAIMSSPSIQNKVSAIIRGALTVDPTTYDMSIKFADELDSALL